MTYTKDTLRQIFQQPFNQQEWQNMLHKYFHAKELRAELERIEDTPENEKGYYLGELNTTDNYRIGLFYYQIQHGNVARKRVGLRNLVKSFINPNWGEFDAALVVFDSGSVWRLSFVCDIKGENTAAKRFTYVFGESDNYYNTPVGRFDVLQRNGISFENIKDAFSVEALSKEFFDEYREHYADIVEYITGKRYVKEKGKWVEKTIHEPCHEIFDQFVAVYKDPEKTVRDYIKKLMGRLVFLQFLQKKEWMGVPADRQDWKGGDTRFLQNKFNEFADKDNFIDGFLEPLFNDLNTNRQNNNDLASPKVGSDIKIPFLNGGLFQLDEEDCSNIRLPQHLLGDVLVFFERYNFTIDENDPNDAQIGVDPEMLGRVFENLLEDNKDKGAFYTPKEIVQYMCQESLIAYLQTGIDDESHKESIRQFVLTHESEHLGSMAEDISIKLLNVKICDPAIGSGAFPMGLLRQLYLCQCAIHPELEEKNAADIKRHIIQNNIYGVDIEKGAVDIARLRFWLSLIVDEDTPKFLPNLDFKIMQGNSLLEQYKGVDLSKMTTLSSEQQEGTQLTWFDNMLDVLRLDLRTKLDEYYNCPDHHRKEELKNEIIDNVKQQLREQSINVDFGELDLSANDQFTLWHTWFYDVFSQGGFDIVIGNPPYIQLQANKGVLADLYSCVKFKTFVRTGDIYSLFYEKGWQILKNGGCLCYITSNKWMRAGYGEQTRDFFAHYTNPEILIDFSGIDIFESATVVTNVLLFTKLENKGQTSCVATTNQDKDCLNNLHEFVRSKKYVQNLSNSDGWIILNPLELALKQKIIKVGTPLKEWDVDIYRGILTGYNDAFIISTKKRNEILENCHSEKERIRTIELIKPLLRGKDIIRYGYEWANLWLINTHNGYKNIDGIDINEYPALKKHLDNYWDKISQRGDKGFTPYNLRNCAYIDEFNRPKVIYPETTKGARFAYDDSGIYIDKTCFMLISDAALYIQKTLSSKLFEVAYNKMFSSVELVNHTYQYNKHALLKLPIIKDEDAIKRLSAIDNEQQIDLFVYHLYDLTYDEVLIVDPESPITREKYENNHE
jgi:hypothetical protein